jgi:hypothetical protein
VEHFSLPRPCGHAERRIRHHEPPLDAGGSCLAAGLFGYRRRRPTSLWPPILGIQVVGSFEGIMELKIGTFTTFMDRKPVLLIVPNQ